MQGDLSKITKPLLHDVVKRKSCYSLIDSCLQKRIVWISASAGYGKTTLVASFLKERPYRFIWYNMDETDIDAAPFFQLMSVAVSALAGEHKISLPEFSQGYFKNVPAFAEKYFKTLFAGLVKVSHTFATKVRELAHLPFIIVFDNYHDTPAASPLHAILSRELSSIPVGIVAIVISREELPVEYTGLRVRRDISFIRWEDLVFSLDDTYELIKSNVEYEVTDETIHKLYKIMDGWVAGMILAINRSASPESILSYDDINVTEKLFDYFAIRLFENTESAIQEFLLKTSYLQEFSASMAERLTGYSQSQKILTQKYCKYFIARKQTSDGLRFQYHPLFREFLLNRAKGYFKRERNEVIHLAANILEENGYLEAGVQLCLDTRHFEHLKSKILRHISTMIVEGKTGLLNKWFTLIPDEFIQSEPWLVYWRGMCLLQFNPLEARSSLITSYVKFKAADDFEGMLTAFCSIVDTFVYEWKDFHPLDYWINEFDEIMKHHGGILSSENISKKLWERIVTSIFSALMFRAPGHADMAYWTGEALKLLHQINDHVQLMSLGHNLIFFFLWTGKIFKAGFVVESLSPVIGNTREQVLAKLMFYRSKALYFYYCASYHEGLQAVEDGLKLGVEFDIHMLDLMFFGTGIYHALAIGRNDVAQVYMNRIIASMNSVQCYDMIYYHHMASLIALMRCDYQQAIEHSKVCLDLVIQSGFHLILGIFTYSVAYVLIEGGQYEEARNHMADTLKIGTATRSNLYSYPCTFAEALIALYENDEEQFRNKINEGINQSNTTGVRYVFFLQSSVARLCKAALERHIEIDSIRKFIVWNNIAPGDYMNDDWPYHLRVYTFGQFQIYKDDKLITFSGKVQRKPLEMLKAIIALGGKEVAIAKLLDALWPDADGDSAIVSFRTTVFRTRKLLGTECDVLITSESHISVNTDYCWVDVWSLQNIINEVKLICKNTHKTYSSQHIEETERKISRLYEKATNTYKGDFLAGEQDQSWATYPRERLKDDFIRLCYQVGEFYEHTKNWDKSIECYQSVMDIDYLQEQCYKHMIKCCLKAGLNTKALLVYNKCKHVFQTVLGIAPPSEIESLLNATIKGRKP